MRLKALVIALFAIINISAQQETLKLPEAELKEQYSSPPKLVVGIVVDMMRYEFIPRFYNRFGEGGFKRLIEDGFNCKNNQLNYIPTKTAPGHAS
ncbi:MAG: alkaline phosphatase family protein, partial [Flavobacteriaceae bacterium]|nr:alkaline phosphatase family protein [Flavobacteriaceae bacterium]